MKSDIYILHTIVDKSRYLDDIPYSVWFMEDNKMNFTTLELDTFQFDSLMEMSLERKYEFLSFFIRKRREQGRIDIIEDIDVNISTADNEKELKNVLISKLREYKLNQIIKK